MECSKCLLRFFMFAFSVILSVAGAAGLIAGVWMKVSPSSIPGGILGGQAGDVEPALSLSYLLMAAGSALLHVGLLGCCAAVAKDGRCVRLLFFVAALIAIMAQAAGVVLALQFPEELAKLLDPKALYLMVENRILALSVVAGVTALEALSAASSMALHCISKRRDVQLCKV